MDLSAIIQHGHFTKAFDPGRRLPESTVDQLLDLLHSSPSSCNVQPWHFVVASGEIGKERVVAGMRDDFGPNVPKIRDASHVIVVCTRSSLSPQFLDELEEQEERDGRFRNPGSRGFWRQVVRGWVDHHEFDLRDLQHWMEKQTYLAVGVFLMGVAELGIGVLPMEGFDQKKLDASLDLRRQDLTSTLVLAMGYRADDDAYATTPKSRLPQDRIFTFLD